MADAIDQSVESRMQRGRWAGLALGVQRGHDFDLRCHGSADLEHNIPVSLDSVFRVGSLTKQYTAALILRLAEVGRLSIDDEITKYLPDYSVNGRTITLHHLLSHTSGLPDYGTLPDVRHRPHNMSPDEIAEKVSSHPFQFEPGEQCMYNNFGYHLLGLVIERVTEQPYRECIKKYLTEPLGLKATLYLDNEPIVANRVRGYSLDNGRLVNAAHLNINLPYAAGAMGASIKDVVAWQTGLNQLQVLNEGSLERMRTPTPLPSGIDNAYGYGVAMANLDGIRKITHTGGINGFASVLSYYPDEELTIAVLVNTQPANPWALESELARIVLGKPARDKVVRDMTSEELSLYCGTYSTDNGEVQIEQNEGALVWLGQRFAPVGDHTFVNIDDPESRITFSMVSNRVEEGRIGREGIDSVIRPIELEHE